jgi:diguanylate cyclase (GGDEF)-like protein
VAHVISGFSSRIVENGAATCEAARDETLLLSIDVALASRNNLLQFSPALSARFERDVHDQRIRDLTQAVWFGVIFSQFFNLTGFFTLPDFAWWNIFARVFMLTPTALLFRYTIGGFDPWIREIICAVAIFGVICIPMLFFYLEGQRSAPFSTSEIILCIIYANTALPLRFLHACAVSMATIMTMVAGICLKPDMSLGLSATILLNLATGITYSLYANFRNECCERRAYLLTLRETLRVTSLTAHNDALTHLTTTDPLTGLFNRRFLEDRLPGLNHAIAEGERLAVFVMDVDYFKPFNDFYGHGAGDACLRALASVFLHEIGDDRHFVIRLGGEEFLVVMRESGALDAVTAAENLRRAIEARAIAHAARADGVGVVTISTGIGATDLKSVASIAALIEIADAALYEAKSLGRNQVRVAPKGIVQEATNQPENSRDTAKKTRDYMAA